MILTIRTDKPEAELGLYEGQEQIVYETWEAHRQLSETILSKIEQLLASEQKQWTDISGIVCFEGPGSFTGLRIGITVGNALANSYDLPIVAAGGDNWIQDGITKLTEHPNTRIVIPDYGRDARITTPRK